MLSNFDFSTTTFLVASFIALLFLVGLIFSFRYTIAKKSEEGYDQKGKVISNTNSLNVRKKYAGADVFRYSQQFFFIGLIMTLMMCVFAFNWTSYEEKVDIPEDALVLEEDIELEPPRSAEPPPPPPPPPPPVIEEVPNELLDEEDDVEFVDQTVDEETELEVIKAPETKIVAAAPPPPPPPPPPAEEEIFVVVEQMPMFPGCESESDIKVRKKCSDQKMLEFIYKNIKYPSVAKDNNIQGTVVLKFVVNKKGKIENINILKDIGATCGQEAERVVKLMNEQNMIWEPGRQRGRPVKVWFMLPVKFKLVS